MLSVDEGKREIYAEGEVGFEDVGFTRNQIFEALSILGEGPVTMHLQSEGGDVFAGQSIYNLIAGHSGQFTVVIDSLSASIATIIQSAADEVLAHKNASIMVHNPFSLMMGDARAFRHTADVLDKLALDSAEIYSEKSGKPVEEWIEIMNKETWFSAQQALEIGLIDGVLERSGTSATKPRAQAVVAVQSITARTNPAAVLSEQRRKMVHSGLKKL